MHDLLFSFFPPREQRRGRMDVSVARFSEGLGHERDERSKDPAVFTRGSLSERRDRRRGERREVGTTGEHDGGGGNIVRITLCAL